MNKRHCEKCVDSTGESRQKVTYLDTGKAKLNIVKLIDRIIN